MKALVTGATGFVGSCLTRRLVGEGHTVRALVRRDSNPWRIADIVRLCTMEEVDLRDAPAVEKAVARFAPEVIFHLATYGGFAVQTETAQIIAANFLGTVNLLNACARVGFGCFVNTGSSSEYGVKAGPMVEQDMLEPVGAYGVSKSAASLYCRSLAVEQNLPVTTVRLFSPFGPWDDGRRLIPYVITSLLRSSSPQLAAPNSVRDFVFIEDVIGLYLKLAAHPLSGEIINAGSGRQHSIGEVVATIAELIGDSPAPCWETKESKRPEPEVWVADVTKAREKLEWIPETDLRDGLAKTIEWFRSHLGLYV
ncbi:MAG: NAD-dependent epimerase/dehydratase family protein [Geobacteraceae bacterium]